jgi:hypothetical protein
MVWSLRRCNTPEYGGAGSDGTARAESRVLMDAGLLESAGRIAGYFFAILFLESGQNVRGTRRMGGCWCST